VEQAIDTARIEDLLPRHGHTLSGGELRRTELALALARHPRCLVADEPFLGIAPKDAQLFMTAFRQMASDGCALFITGHEVEVLFPLADQVIWMTAGTTHHLGTREEALGHHQFVQEYVGVTQAGRLTP
jgi:lipopolysaccharide export system ATP-binding protein